MEPKAVRATTLYDGTYRPHLSDVYITFRGNRIISITRRKPAAEVIGEGTVTPGFIDGHSHIGMSRSGEPSSEDESNERMSPMLPLVSALDSVYMDDTAFRESIEHGVLYSHIMPGSANIIGGGTVLIRNFASHIDDAVVCRPGIKVALGFNPRSTRSADWKGDRPYTRMGAVSILRGELIKAGKAAALLKAGRKVKEELEPQTEALIGILEGRERLMVHVHKEDDIVNLIRLMKEFGFSCVINHASDVHSPLLWEKVRKARLDVIYGPLDAFSYKVELKHESWRNAKLLADSGVRFGLMTDHPVILQRNLVLQLRFFRRFGLSREKCISLISGETASILGMKDMGTLREGAPASFVVWNGDPFSLEAWPAMVVGEGMILVEHQ